MNSDAVTPSVDQGQRVAVLGLGIMGSAFAGHLRAAGYRVAAFDPDSGRRSLAERESIVVHATADEAVCDADIVLCSLPSAQALDDTVEALCRVCHANKNADFGKLPLVVELSTLSLSSKLQAQQILGAAGYDMLDCPVSGTGAQAARRDIVVYASGEAQACATAKPLLEAISSRVIELGAFGNGTRLKLIANLLVAIHNVAVAEALSLAEHGGLDLGEVCAAIAAGGAAGSRILELRGPLMSQGRYQPPTMRMDLWQKDLALIKEYAAELDAELPLFQATLPLYEAALQRVGGDVDTAAVFELLRLKRRSFIDS